MITLDRSSPLSLYEQLYRELKKAIISGELPPGKQLPSTRALALQYDISRNTVNTAYSQLLVEGFITSRPGSGFYVEKIPLPVTLKQTTPSAIPEAQSPSCTYDFSYGSLDVNIYRNRAFRQAMSRAWNNMEKRNSIPYEPAAGSLHLREAITHMLHSSRGVVATPDQIILTSGHYYSLFLLTAFFSSSHYSLILEDPGYPAVWDIFQKENFSIHAIPAGKTGIDTAPLHQYTNALLYITPSHQYPLGSILPIKNIWKFSTGPFKPTVTLSKTTMTVSFTTAICPYLPCNPSIPITGLSTWEPFPKASPLTFVPHISLCLKISPFT